MTWRFTPQPTPPAPTPLAGAQSWNCPAGGGRRVGGGAGCAVVLVLLPPAVRGAAAVRAVPCRAGCIGRAGPGVFWDARL